MPSYKYLSESESESEIDEKEYERDASDDGEPGPDDTFHFRQSFSKTPRHHYAPPPDEDMNEPSFQTEEEIADQTFDTMQDEDFLSEEGSLVTDEEEEEPQFGNDPFAAAVRIEKRATWLEQIEYTDRAVKRLKAIDNRERLRNSKVHWGGRTPEIKYSAEDMERDLFGETPKSKKRSGFDYLQVDALKQGIFDQKSWDAKELEKDKPNPAFRTRWGPGDVLIHRPNARNRMDDGVVSFTKLNLSALEQDAAQKQAQRLLERQADHTTFTVDRTGIPIATASSTLQFHTFSDSSSLHTGPVRPIDEYETHLWHLASILFDDLPNEQSEKSQRKRALSTFFKDLVSRSVWNDLSRTRDPAERIFLNLTGYRINDACIEATKNKDLHLATLLALAEESTPEFRMDIHNQLEAWRKDGSNADIQLWYRAVYETLAGEIDGRGNALSQMGLSKRVDWRRAFAMRLWFGIPADGEIKDAVQEYWMACQQDSSIAKPLPWYAKDNKVKTGVYDGLFQLLRLYSGSGVNTTLDDALNPCNFSSTPTDVRVAWHLYIILSELKGKASFADAYGMKANPISDAGEKLTLAYVAQLEDMDLWQWAIYVALHLRRENTRKGVIMDLLARHIHTIPNHVEEQGVISRLVDQWHLPMEWILEAKALHARSQGNHFLSAKNLVLAKSHLEAQKTIITHLAPQAVISTRLSDLEELLLMFDTPPAGWDIGGQIYLDYISLVQYQGVGERRRRASGSKKDAIVRLLRGLPAMEAQSFEQRVAQSEMARVVANIVVSSPEMSKEISGVMRLPLLEGDVLRITRKVAEGMLDQVLAG